jgi:hypothetical protein
MYRAMVWRIKASKNPATIMTWISGSAGSVGNQSSGKMARIKHVANADKRIYTSLYPGSVQRAV